MKIGKFLLKLNVIMGVATNVARSARASTYIMQRVLHRSDHLRMLSHAEIIVRTPHRDILGSIMPGKTPRIGIRPFIAQDIYKNAIAPFGVKPVNRFFENSIVIHGY